jgi:hypothetical protein
MKQDGPPSESGTTKVLIVGTENHRMPLVAHPQEPTKVTQAPDPIKGMRKTDSSDLETLTMWPKAFRWLMVETVKTQRGLLQVV